MKTDGNAFAFPVHPDSGPDGVGLTKREYFAAMAMQGLQANDQCGSAWSVSDLAKGAVEQADALIDALNK